ncbi:hypothetical protein M9Y10_001092 [Tritrichomonas musculus]|uniref:Vacuolar ATP synthase subunit E n=1 Tax=Tritrichomonas musculus TaxID=1915356 RepID=A0ABR2L619_9EUKA
MTDKGNQKAEIFALYLARLRAEEIELEAREQFNQDFQKIIDQSYAKLNNDLELSKNEIQRNAKIDYSVTKNEQRIKKLDAQQKIISEAQEGARKKLRELHDSSSYKKILGKLIYQGAQTLSEKNIRVSVLKSDIDLAKHCIDAYKDEFSELDCTATVDEEHCLDDKLIGGCMLINEAETIRVDNSFEGRLQLATEGCLPKIAEYLNS